jgi:hypothetical protein
MLYAMRVSLHVAVSMSVLLGCGAEDDGDAADASTASGGTGAGGSPGEGGSPGTGGTPAGGGSAGAGGASGDGGTPGAGGTQPVPTVVLGGLVRGFMLDPIAGATVGLRAGGGATATTDAQGHFTLSVPVDTAVTLKITKAGYAPTVEQSFKLHADADGFEGFMATTEQFGFIQQAGGAPAGTSAFLVILAPAGNPPTCNLAGGSTLSTTPSTGRFVYGRSDNFPDASLDSQAQGGFWAYLTGATPGTYRPSISPMGCRMAVFPFDRGPVTVLGDIEVDASPVLYDVTLFLQ